MDKARENYYTHHFSQFQKAEFTESDKQFYQKAFSKTFPTNKNAHILEIGTGTGKFLRTLKDLGYCNVTGVDVSEEMVAIARNNSTACIVLSEDIIDFLLQQNKMFDYVYMLDVIEHIRKEKIIATLDAIYASLKPNGILILSTENMASPINRLQAYLDFTHEYNYTEITLKQVLSIAQFSNIKIWGEAMHLFPLQPLHVLRWMLAKLMHIGFYLLNKLDRPGGIVPFIYSKELYASAQVIKNSM